MAEQLTVNLALKDGNMTQKIKSINSEIKNLESGFKLAGAGVKDFEKSEEGLSSKLKLQEGVLEQLRKKIEVYKQKQEECTATLNKATDSYNKQEVKVRDLKLALEKAEQTYGKNSKEVKTLSEELKKAERSFETKRNAVINADNSLKGINTTINKTETECRELESEIRDLNSSLDNIDGGGLRQLGDDMVDASGKAVDFGAKMVIVGEGVRNVGQGVKETGKEIVETLAEMVEKGAEYQVEQTAITTMLGDQEQAVRKWASTQADSLGMTEQQLTQVTAKNMMLAEKMGLTGDSAREMAQSMSVVTQDLATFYDVDPTEMVNKFSSALNGSVEIMDQYGVDISVASLENSKYVQSLGKSWKAMTEAEKKQARYNKILEDTAKVQGNAKNESEGFGVQLQLLKTNISEMVKQLGEKLIPLLEPFLQKIGQIVEKLKIWVENNPQLATALMVIAGVIGVVLTVLGSLLVPIGSLIILIGALTPMIASAGGIMAFFSASILPVIAVIGAVIAIVIGLFMAIKSNWEGIKQATMSLIETCRPQFEALGQAFSGLWDMCVSIYDTIIAPLFTMIGQVIEQCIIWVTPIIQRLVPVFSSAFNFISSLWNNILQPVFQALIWIIEKIGAFVKPIFDVFVSVICGAMDLIITPIRFVIDMFSELFGAIGSVGGAVLDFFGGLFGGKSIDINYNEPQLDTQAKSFVRNRDIDNVALSGSYYNAKTLASREASDFVQFANNIPSAVFGNSNGFSGIIETFNAEIKTMKNDNSAIFGQIGSALSEMAKAIEGMIGANSEEKFAVEVTSNLVCDGRTLASVVSPHIDKATNKYNQLALR